MVMLIAGVRHKYDYFEEHHAHGDAQFLLVAAHRQNLDGAVASANFSPLRLRRTCRKQINTSQIVASLEVGLGVGYY
jgi:hypothetical protein